ncbi:MAG TPA: hypothetical protein VNH21_12370 [Steroidobacteraceae bacterium]|nr:hypothetical protein [Steroidobacteraceae bacterium]
MVGSAISGGKASAGGAQAQQTLAQQRADLAPFRDTGTNALGVAGDISGANGPDAATAAMGNFFTSPGYDFRLSEGLRGVDAGAASKGLLHSGATIKAEDRFSQGLASDEFSQYYNRLFGLASLGETAAAGGAANASTSAQLSQGAGNTQASIFGNAAQGLGSTVSGLLSNPKVQNSLFGPTSGDLSGFDLSQSEFAPGFSFGAR